MGIKFKNLSCLVSVVLVMAQNVFAYDFSKESNTTQEALENSLRGNLASYADTFIYCEQEYGVNAIALASVAVVESGWGTSNLANNKNNLFGWRTETGDYKAFPSKEDCIIYIAKSLSENYLSEDGKYYTGGTKTKDINKYYSESTEWAETINEVISQIDKRCIEYELENICPS